MIITRVGLIVQYTLRKSLTHGAHFLRHDVTLIPMIAASSGSVFAASGPMHSLHGPQTSVRSGIDMTCASGGGFSRSSPSAAAPPAREASRSAAARGRIASSAQT